jgi:hypothetical protein
MPQSLAHAQTFHRDQLPASQVLLKYQHTSIRLYGTASLKMQIFEQVYHRPFLSYDIPLRSNIPIPSPSLETWPLPFALFSLKLLSPETTSVFHFLSNAYAEYGLLDTKYYKYSLTLPCFLLTLSTNGCPSLLVASICSPVRHQPERYSITRQHAAWLNCYCHQSIVRFLSSV